jgi:cell division protease FtsH
MIHYTVINAIIIFAGCMVIQSYLKLPTFRRNSVELFAYGRDRFSGQGTGGGGGGQRPLSDKFQRHYHYSKKYYEDALKRIQSNNFSSNPNETVKCDANDTTINIEDLPGITIILKGEFMQPFNDDDGDDDGEDLDRDLNEEEQAILDLFGSFNKQPSMDQTTRGGVGGHNQERRKQPHQRRDNPYVRGFRYIEDKEKLKSKNFEVTKNYGITFKDVGGYKKIKDELRQSVDILRNYAKYAKYNVRIPKGLILEGPPGNGKTLLAKSLAGEAGCGFIAVSGADFQEKYVGVGSSRIRELFELAKKNEPCIIFIDEIDAVGRHRSGDGESSSSERDNTLNALLVELDGFKNNTGVFVVGATNRIDLLDPALVRPGRVDKKIFIGLPDAVTRKEVLQIHIRGKPHDESIILDDLVDTTDGLSCAQIENLLNEAMLYALRYNETAFSYADIDVILNKIIAGWQSTDHEFTQDMIERIAVHEMGHAILGYLSKYHSKLLKVVLNLSSPKTPGYTVFERSGSSIYLKEALFEHLIILLGGRIAEEVIYNVSVTTGAINDFEEALKLAERMIVHYGMGDNVLYPSSSEKYKEIIDTEVSELINYAYLVGRLVLENCKQIIQESSVLLQKEKKLLPINLSEMIRDSYPEVLKLKDIFTV